MNISDFFIKRPIFAGVVSAIIFLVGLISLFRLPVSEYPEVVPPTVVVKATYPGANPKTISETVAAPLEQAINGVENSIYMFSQATSDGVMTLTVTFKLGTNLDTAQVQVQNRVAQTEAKLPEEVRRLGITTTKASPDLMMVVHLFSPDNRYDDIYVRNYATLQVRDVLARLPGVGDVPLFGSGDYAMRIWLDPNKVAAKGLTASDVVAAIREQNIQVAAGAIGKQPNGTPVDTELLINTQGRLVTEEQFGAIIVKIGPGGERVQLRDVARIELGASDYALRSLLNNKAAVALPIFQLPGSNAIATSNAVRAAMAELKKNFPDGLDYSIVYDPDHLRPQFDREGGAHPGRGHPPRGAGRHPVPADLAGLDHPACRRPRVPRRHLSRDERAGLFHQRPLSLRPGPRHRHRGRRRDRRCGERRAQHRARPLAHRGHEAGHARGDGPDHRHRARPFRRLHSHRLHQRPDRPILQAVRHHDRDLDHYLGLQLPHALACLERPAAEGP